MRRLLFAAAIVVLGGCGSGGGGGDGSTPPPPPVERDWSVQVLNLTTADIVGNLYADEPLHYRLFPQYTPYGVSGAASPTITVEVLRDSSVVTTYSVTNALSATYYDIDIPSADWAAAWGANTVAVRASIAGQSGFTETNWTNNTAWFTKSYTPRVDGTYATARSGGLNPHSVVVTTGDVLTVTGQYQARSMNGTATLSVGAFSYSIPITTLGGIEQYQAAVTGTVAVNRVMTYTIVMQQRFLISGVGWGVNGGVKSGHETGAVNRPWRREIRPSVTSHEKSGKFSSQSWGENAPDSRAKHGVAGLDSVVV